MNSIQNWLKLSVLSLALSGVFSIFIVMLRTPFLTNFFPDKSIFSTALIIHVNLSVLFWFLNIGMMIVCKNLKPKLDNIVLALQKLIFLSIIMVSVSPLIGSSQPFMNNYVPILHNFVFILGLAIFFAIFSIISLVGIFAGNSESKSLSIINICSLASFAISCYKISLISYPIDQHNYYEMFFWGGGHLLQFLYISIVIYILFDFTKNVEHAVSRKFFLWMNAFFVAPIPLVQLTLSADDSYYFDLFTEHMKIAGAIALLTALISIFISMSFTKSFKLFEYSIFSNNSKSLIFISFICFLILFSFGGILALNINQVNTVIPAHYHGSIVGITIAIMGYIYILINSEFSKINFKAASMQIILYSFGQLMHISALAYSGGYGALRKTPGVELSKSAKISMGFMGLGGLLAIVAGLMFVYICCRRFLTKEKAHEAN
jgi:hypothetical protein